MAECGGHAPLALWAHDVFSTDSRLAGPVHVPFSKLVPTVGVAAPAATQYALRVRRKALSRHALHPHYPRSELGASALGYVGEMVLAAGL